MDSQIQIQKKSEPAAMPKKQLKRKCGSKNSPLKLKQTKLQKASAELLSPAAASPQNSTAPATCDSNIDAINMRYNLEAMIGKGGFGDVFAATRKSDHQKVAIKQMPFSKINVNSWTTDPETKKVIPSEVILLRKCQAASGVIRLIDYFESKTHGFIVMERDTDFVDLFDFISVHQNLSPSDSRHVVRQVTQTLAKCQTLGVIHRDLKQENVLINKNNGSIKLLDFGLAQQVTESNQKFTTFKGTGVYKPPEFIKSREAFADSLTVWSIGCFAYSLLFGDVPFQNDDEIAALLFKDKGICDLPPDCRDLILKCLRRNPESRPLLQDLVNHPWISFPSGLPAQAHQQLVQTRCSYEVVEIDERPSTSISTASSANSNVENEESRDPRIYMKLRRKVAK